MQQFSAGIPEHLPSPLNTIDADGLIQDIFEEGKPNYLNLVSAIQYENKPKFGPSSISNILFRVIDYNADSLAGRLRVGYDMQLTFGCEDFVKDHLNQHSYYNFKIDQADKTINFQSDQPDAPSTADEF